ncbi:type IV pilin-like G/H family protein [Myxacorys almedinensis]|uniref:Uncharacterized protein n=1 Tax=Myxacorys almedinensis A TaxID=2690445 RepID=A0A8J7Z006_9CYAN|nr:type IV pilin-like G/H family protein [Myxacorys almedinensis]NDJ16525.1 hypothetical protein [Myxacorys almedinensis A]
MHEKINREVKCPIQLFTQNDVDLRANCLCHAIGGVNGLTGYLNGSFEQQITPHRELFQMEQSNLLDLAKQGEPDAIAALMNAVLEPKGIVAHAERERDCLSILLESSKALNRETLVAFIQKGLLELGTPSIKTAKVKSQKLGTASLFWTKDLELYPRLADDLLWLDDPDENLDEPDALIELEEDSPLWLEDFEVEEPDAPEPIVEETSEATEAEAEESEEPISSFISSLKTYWLAYSLPVLIVVIGAFLTGGVMAFLSTSKAVQSEAENAVTPPDEQTPEDQQQGAKDYLKAMNTAQEKFYQQNNRFANSLEELERSANLIAQSYDYAYRLKVSNASGDGSGQRALLTASPREAGLRSYIGGVFVAQKGTTSVICQTQKPSMDAPLVPEFSSKGEVSCAPRSAKVQE